MKLKSIECTINTTTGPLREYIDSDVIPDTPDEAICYIQAQAGESFSLHFDVPSDDGICPPVNSLNCKVYFNGNKELDIVLDPGKSEVLSSCVNGPRARGSWIKREFVFDKLTVTENSDIMGIPKRKLEGLGEIKMAWFRYNSTGSLESRPQEKAVNAVKVVHENELKGRHIEHLVGCVSTPRYVVMLLS
jgi:hypothetical protein